MHPIRNHDLAPKYYLGINIYCQKINILGNYSARYKSHVVYGLVPAVLEGVEKDERLN